MRNEIFDLFHLSYIFGSLLITAVLIFVIRKKVTQRTHFNHLVKFFGLLTVFLHLSPLWLDFLIYGRAEVNDNMIFPIFFCNLSMYLLLIVAFLEKRNTPFFKCLAMVTAYSGIIGALISLIYPEYYVSGEGLTYPIIKSMLSHSTMLIGGFILVIGHYFPVQKRNTLIYFIGMLGFGFIGLVVNLLFRLYHLGPVNAMYLQKPPLEEAPFLNVFVITALMLITIFGLTTLHEKLTKGKVTFKKVETVQI